MIHFITSIICALLFGVPCSAKEHVRAVEGIVKVAALFTTPYMELYQATNGLGGAKFFGWVDEPITGFSVISYAGSEGFAMGNFVEGGAPVPEPSTFLLLGAGLAGFGFLKRKMKM